METKKAPKGQVELTISLDTNLYKEIMELSEDKGIDISSQIKFILWDYLVF